MYQPEKVETAVEIIAAHDVKLSSPKDMLDVFDTTFQNKQSQFYKDIFTCGIDIETVAFAFFEINEGIKNF